MYESIFTVKQSINGGEATGTCEQQPQLPAVDDTSMYSNISFTIYRLQLQYISTSKTAHAWTAHGA